MKKKKIALFISSLQKGGSERVMVNLADYFVKENYDTVLVTQHLANVEYELNDKVRRKFSEITAEETTGNRIQNFIRRFSKLRAIWKEEKPDVILSFIGKNNVMAILTAWGLGIPVVVSVRGEPKEEYASKGLCIAAKVLFHKAACVVMQTKESVSFFPKGIRKKTKILKNSLNPQFIRPIYQGQREKTVVAVGRIDENKNHRMLIRAFAKLADKFPDYKLIIYGNGESRNQLEDLVRNLQQQERVFMPGVINNVGEAIEKAGIFVLTSFSEGMPNTLMEAMALGLPCISTDCPCGGPGELIENGENGILIPVGDEKALTLALEKMMNEPEWANNLGKKASELQKQCNPTIVNKSWKELLESCMR